MATLPITIGPGETLAAQVTFSPVHSGALTGVLTAVTDTGGLTVPLSGTGGAVPPLKRLHTAGNQILDSDNAKVRLRSINWFGAESSNYIPHGIWSNKWTDLCDQIAAFGFNCVRLPFSDAILNDANVPNGIDTSKNPDLVGLTPLECLDKIINYFGTKGIWVVLDHHRTSAGSGTDGWPPASGDGGYSAATWLAMWQALATRYAANPTVCGFDPHNEPHNPTWDTWAAWVEPLANGVHTIAPDWLCMVEGVGIYNDVSYWWGGQLQGVATRPIALTVPNRVVYSPHEYGQSVAAGQPWLAYEGQTPPAGWPTNLYAKWQSIWGFIFENNIAPIWIGEFGGFFGYNGSGVDNTKPNRDQERQWLATLTTYLNGDFDGNGASNLPVGSKGGSFAYWSLNPNSGDTGGLLQDDFVTPQSGKFALLQGLLTA